MLGRSAVVVLVVVFVAMFAACGWDWTVVPNAAGDGGVSKDGTCTSNDECRSDELCRFADGRCSAGARGACVSAPLEKQCTAPEEPQYVACGCDGKTAANACAVEATRKDLAIEAACPAPPDTFRCGYYFCPRSTFCFRSASPKGDFFSCADWPCTEQTCACQQLSPKCPSATCSTDGAGVTTVICTE